MVLGDNTLLYWLRFRLFTSESVFCAFCYFVFHPHSHGRSHACIYNVYNWLGTSFIDFLNVQFTINLTLVDENEAQEILKDLIDDREIEDEDSDGSVGPGKRKKSDEEDEDDDRLEDDDYDLLEENLGVKVQRRKRFKRVRPQIDDDESDGEDQNDNGDLQRERIAERIFDSEDVSVLIQQVNDFSFTLN